LVVDLLSETGFGTGSPTCLEQARVDAARLSASSSAYGGVRFTSLSCPKALENEVARMGVVAGAGRAPLPANPRGDRRHAEE
jgi:hypothetical protein